MRILGFDITRQKSPVSVAPEKKEAGRKNPKITQIVESFKDNSRKDIQKWRQAMTAAINPESPKFNLYHDIVDDLMTDGHLQSQIEMRKSSTLNTDYQVINRKTKKVNEEITFILQQQWFYKFLDGSIDETVRGTNLAEFLSFQAEKIEMNFIPRRNVVPTRKQIFPDLTKPDFIDYSNPAFDPWLLQIGENFNLGIINNIIPNLIWKRNVMQAWAEFCEKFGMPLITATTNTTDAKVIDSVHEMLLNLGQASVGTFPTGTDIKFQEANRQDAYQVYMQFMQANSNEISKVLVGSTMLSDQGTNRSQTEVHERSLDNRIAQADKRKIQFIVNDQLFPLLRQQGYNINDDDVFEWKTAEQESSLTELWTITNGLISNGYEVQQEWISQTFNIPIEGKKKTLSSDSGANIAAGFFPQPVSSIRPNRYNFDCSCGKHNTPLDSIFENNIRKQVKKLVRSVYDNKNIIGAKGDLIASEALLMVKGLRDNFKTYNPYTGPDQLVLQMMEYNVFEFSASKTEARYAAMTELMTDGDKGIRDYNDFERLCLEKTEDLNTSYLQTEYNLSIAVGQNSAAYVRFMAEKDTVTNLVQYQTVGDENVREAHQILDGKIFSLDDKEAMKLWPPNGYGCRCEMLQYIGSGKPISGRTGTELMYSRDVKFKNSQFEINRGDLKEVFTKKQFYSDNKGLSADLNKMTYDQYDLKKWSDLKGNLKPIKLDNTITSENVKELFKKEKDYQYMGFSDYMGRKMVLPEKTFNSNTSGKALKEDKHQIFPHLKDILNSPDEVWLNEYGKNAFGSNYIKFYEDRAVIVKVNINNKMEGLEILDWYNLNNDDAKQRTGIKIK
ncbi:phage portal protein family protein [Chryseobacterium arthrosphaerae]|uniref:phage portal protein family protein n=1 Tax=Chryseobacterium arthrosphaerae TaxID=651561 RepID=UPI003D34C7DB